MQHIVFNTKKSILCALIVVSSVTAKAQIEWQSRNALSASASLSEKIGLKMSHLRSYNISENFSDIFNQTALQVSYDLPGRWDISGGAQVTTPASSDDPKTRVYLRASHSTRLPHRISWTNALRLENNSKNEDRFRQRIGLSTKLGLRKRLDFLNLSPSATYALYYNIGGDPIRYYDKDAKVIARQTPDGFHRSRLMLNINSKINKYLRIGLGYMRQWEFNFLTPETRKINVFDPVRNRTLRPFNNFNAIGLSAQINLDPFIQKINSNNKNLEPKNFNYGKAY